MDLKFSLKGDQQKLQKTAKYHFFADAGADLFLPMLLCQPQLFSGSPVHCEANRTSSPKLSSSQFLCV